MATSRLDWARPPLKDAHTAPYSIHSIAHTSTEHAVHWRWRWLSLHRGMSEHDRHRYYTSASSME